MMNDKLFFLGRVPARSVENRARKGWVLTYTPAGSYLSKAPLIGFYGGPTGHYEGGAVEAAVWMDRRPSSFEKIGDRIVENRPEPGWFERLCREVGCDWFIPIFHRLAKGEDVSEEEVLRTYSLHHHGAQLRQGTLAKFFNQ